ncbi:MAG: hypothetical protein U0521_25215 [Anaerolineae bacterium]
MTENSVPGPQSAVLRLFSPLLIIALSAAIQFHALAQDTRFYPDEALFSTFARHAALGGDWLLHGDLDKTPLSIYASAVSMSFVAAQPANGVLDFAPRLGEFAARLPGALAMITLTAFTCVLAQRLYHDRATAAWATVRRLLALQRGLRRDRLHKPLMLALAGLSLLLAARGRWLWSGAAMALAFASKQQALYLLPLRRGRSVWAMNRLTLRGRGCRIWQGWRQASPRPPGGMRCAQPTSLWALALAGNNPARLIRSGDRSAPDPCG